MMLDVDSHVDGVLGPDGHWTVVVEIEVGHEALVSMMAKAIVMHSTEESLHATFEPMVEPFGRQVTSVMANTLMQAIQSFLASPSGPLARMLTDIADQQMDN